MLSDGTDGTDGRGGVYIIAYLQTGRVRVLWSHVVLQRFTAVVDT